MLAFTVKKVASVILLFCLLVFTGGYHLIIAGYRIALKTEIRTSLLQNPEYNITQTFHFASIGNAIQNTSFSWDDGEEEFTFEGTLYDVVSITYQQNQVRIECYKDKAETKLVNLTAEIQQKQNRQPSGSKNVIHKMMQVVMEIQPSPEKFIYPGIINTFSSISLFPTVGHTSLVSQPPETVFV